MSDHRQTASSISYRRSQSSSFSSPLSKPTRNVKSWSENDNTSIATEGNNKRRYDVRTLMDIRRKMESSAESSIPNVDGLIKPDDDTILKENQGNSRTNKIHSSESRTDVPDRSAKQSSAKKASIEKRDFRNDREGFARFLQEHTSPRHQRVTAGGRIVPFDPDSRPAPEFKLPKRNREEKTDADAAKTQQRTKHEKSTIAAAVAKNRQEERIFDQNQSSNAGKPPTSPIPLNSPPPALFGNSPTPLIQQMLPSLDQNQEVHNGDEFTSNNGADAHNRDATAWSNPILSPMSPQPLAPAYPPAFSYGMSPNQFMANPAMYPMSPPAIGSNNAFCGGFSYDAESPVQSWEGAQGEFLRLSQQISELDRYMALNTFHIDAAAKKALVEQRVELVKNLDAVRATKEFYESTAQFSGRHRPEAYAFKQAEESGSQQNPQFHDPNAFQSNPWGFNYMPAYPSCYSGVNFGAEGGVPMAIPWQPAYPGNWPTSKRPTPTEIYSTHTSNDHSQGLSSENHPQSGENKGKQAVAPDFEIPRRDRAPVELMRVYHNIENAVRNGGDVAPHLEELSNAISGLKLRHSRTLLRSADKLAEDMSRHHAKNPSEAEKGGANLPEANVLSEISRNSEPSCDRNKKRSPVAENDKQEKRFSSTKNSEAHASGQTSTTENSEQSRKGTQAANGKVHFQTSKSNKKSRGEANANTSKPKGGFFSWLGLKSPRRTSETTVSSVLHAFRDEDRKPGKDYSRKQAERNTAEPFG